MEKNLKTAIEKLQAAAAVLTPELLDAIGKGARESRVQYEEALLRFTDDREDRQSGARSGAAMRARRLQEIEKQKADLTDAIGDAYSEQQIEKAHALEGELEDLAREEYGVKEAAKHVGTVKVRGDLGLFADLKAAYDRKTAEEQAALQILEQLRSELRKLEVLVRNYKEKAADLSKAYNSLNGPAEDQMVEAAESILGPLDLTGGLEGFDGREHAAKIAIVCRSSQSKDPVGKLKNAPAFKKWIELLKKLPKGGVSHE